MQDSSASYLSLVIYLHITAFSAAVSHYWVIWEVFHSFEKLLLGNHAENTPAVVGICLIGTLMYTATATPCNTWSYSLSIQPASGEDPLDPSLALFSLLSRLQCFFEPLPLSWICPLNEDTILKGGAHEEVMTSVFPPRSISEACMTFQSTCSVPSPPNEFTSVCWACILMIDEDRCE